MTPLFGCFPVFMMLASIGLMIAAFLVVGAMRGRLGGEPAPAQEEPPQRLPVWFIVLAFVVPPIVLFLLSFVTAG